LDDGPVVLQAKVPVLKNDDAESLAKRVLIQEHIIYPKVIQWFCESRLCFKKEQLFLDGKALIEPKIINSNIN
jgi:phosphoribosylglycinamide formyltransferase-1